MTDQELADGLVKHVADFIGWLEKAHTDKDVGHTSCTNPKMCSAVMAYTAMSVHALRSGVDSDALLLEAVRSITSTAQGIEMRQALGVLFQRMNLGTEDVPPKPGEVN